MQELTSQNPSILLPVHKSRNSVTLEALCKSYFELTDPVQVERLLLDSFGAQSFGIHPKWDDSFFSLPGYHATEASRRRSDLIVLASFWSQFCQPRTNERMRSLEIGAGCSYGDSLHISMPVRSRAMAEAIGERGEFHITDATRRDLLTYGYKCADGSLILGLRSEELLDAPHIYKSSITINDDSMRPKVRPLDKDHITTLPGNVQRQPLHHGKVESVFVRPQLDPEYEKAFGNTQVHHEVDMYNLKDSGLCHNHFIFGQHLFPHHYPPDLGKLYRLIDSVINALSPEGLAIIEFDDVTPSEVRPPIVVLGHKLLKRLSQNIDPIHYTATHQSQLIHTLTTLIAPHANYILSALQSNGLREYELKPQIEYMRSLERFGVKD